MYGDNTRDEGWMNGIRRVKARKEKERRMGRST